MDMFEEWRRTDSQKGCWVSYIRDEWGKWNKGYWGTGNRKECKRKVREKKMLKQWTLVI